MLSKACGVNIAGSLIFTSLKNDYKEFESCWRDQKKAIIFFNNPVKTFKYIVKNRVDTVFFDFILPVSRNLALRILKSSICQVNQLVLLSRDEDQFRFLKIKSIDHFFDLYNEFCIESDSFLNPFEYLSKRDYKFLSTDPSSWCYECRTDMFYGSGFFNDFSDSKIQNKKEFLDLFYSNKAISSSMQILMAKIEKASVCDSFFVWEIKWEGLTYHVSGCCKSKDDLFFILGSIH